VEFIEKVSDLEALYDAPGEASLVKVATKMTPLYRKWIMASRFCILSTVGPDGTDATPRGDDGPVVLELDETTLALPDWRGNNRIDNLRNIIADPRVSLMFMVPGSNNVVRVNGRAKVTVDAGLLDWFARKELRPKSVTVIEIDEIYSQCARALLRSGLWTAGDQSAELPSMGDILVEMKQGFDGATYDAEWGARAAKTMW
jgi:PPOX class probable FMN-dependent enzyme